MGGRVLTFLAEGFEEVEAVTPIDYLRRAGIEVTTASIAAAMVKGSHGISLAADTTIAALEQSGQLNAESWDGTFVPGGMPGASNLAACAPVGNFFKAMAAAGKTIAAICASPAVFLAPLGLLEGKKFTCYPGMEKQVNGAGEWLAGKVVVDGNLVTSRGPGTACAFALALIEIFAGKDAAKSLGESALL
ncbi:MAG: DJ-1/PfpI family protein [Treponema sp.]|jgi:4-methyl-5(b-hydroxyethyl)-thiazole monophosphate biosynthesis|nr:DJ-1/PfpI family protein [Treponema sp.]